MRNRLSIGILLLVLVPAIGAPLAAQTAADHGAVRFVAGAAKLYIDEPWQSAWGGSVRLRVYKRLSVEPELVFSPGSQYQQWSFVPNLVLDLREPDGRVTPYVIGGAGYLHKLAKSINYRSGGPAWNGGIGVRIRAGARAFVAPEFRLGYISRFVVSAGYSF